MSKVKNIKIKLAAIRDLLDEIEGDLSSLKIKPDVNTVVSRECLSCKYFSKEVLNQKEGKWGGFCQHKEVGGAVHQSYLCNKWEQSMEVENVKA